MTVSYHNGAFVLNEQVKFDSSLFSLNYALCAFEGIRSFRSGQRTNVFRLHDHMIRFLKSCEYLDISSPHLDVDSLCEATTELVRRNNDDELYIRPIAFFGQGIISLQQKPEANVSIFTLPMPSRTGPLYASLELSSYARDIRSVEQKISRNYFDSIMALKNKAEYFDDVLLTTDGEVISETSAHNVFFKQADNTFVTPKVSHCLPGLTRDTAIKLLRHHGHSVIERDIKAAEINKFVSSFTTSTATDIRLISRVNNTDFRTDDLIIEWLVAEYARCVKGECGISEEWNRYV